MVIAGDAVFAVHVLETTVLAEAHEMQTVGVAVVCEQRVHPTTGVVVPEATQAVQTPEIGVA